MEEQPSGETAEPNSFAVNCFNLWLAGNTYIPVVAECYAQASNEVGMSHALGKGDDRFIRNLEGGGASRALKNYQDLRDLVQEALSRTAQHLYDVGEVLEQAAIHFAETDTEHANELGTAKEQLDQQIDDHQSSVEADKLDADNDDLLAPPSVELKPDDSKSDSEIVEETLPEEQKDEED